MIVKNTKEYFVGFLGRIKNKGTLNYILDAIAWNGPPLKEVHSSRKILNIFYI